MATVVPYITINVTVRSAFVICTMLLIIFLNTYNVSLIVNDLLRNFREYISDYEHRCINRINLCHTCFVKDTVYILICNCIKSFLSTCDYVLKNNTMTHGATRIVTCVFLSYKWQHANSGLMYHTNTKKGYASASLAFHEIFNIIYEINIPLKTIINIWSYSTWLLIMRMSRSVYYFVLLISKQ